MHRKEEHKEKEQLAEGGLTIALCRVTVTLGQDVQTDRIAIG